MPRHFVGDSDSEEIDLSLEDEVTPEEDNDQARRVSEDAERSVQEHELRGDKQSNDCSTGSTENLLREAYAPIIDDYSTNGKDDDEGSDDDDVVVQRARKRKRCDDQPAESHSKKARETTQAGEDIYDIPSSPPKAVVSRARVKSKATPPTGKKHMTSSEIRAIHQETPTEAATSSTSYKEKSVLLSRSTVDSAVSMDCGMPQFDGPDDHDILQKEGDGPNDDVVVLLPTKQRKEAIPVADMSLRSPEPFGKSKKRRRFQEEEESDVEDVLSRSDELTIGLPREMYRPRSSRRRASPAPKSHTDSHVTPENKTKKSKSKRRKVEADSTVVEEAVNDGAAQLVDMGFSPQRAHRVSRETGGDVQRATELVLGGHGVASQERTANGRTIRSSRQHVANGEDPLPASPERVFEDDSVPAEDASRSEIISIHSMDTTPADTPAKQIAIRAKAPASEKKKKRGQPKKSTVTPLDSSGLAKLTDSQLQGSNEAPEEAEIPKDAGEISPPKKKKKGRGRPRKSAAAAEVARIEDLAEAEMPDINIKAELVELRGNATAVAEHTIADPDETEEKENQPPNASPVKEAVSDQADVDIDQSKLVSTKPEPTASPAPTSAAGVKVPYRVGLSKRSRFPSLLTSFRNKR